MNQLDSLTLKSTPNNPHKLESSGPELSSADFVARLNICAEIAGSMNALARLSGMSQSGMRRYFVGGEPTRPVLVAIARAVGVNLLWLATGEGEMYAQQPQGDLRTSSGGTNLRDPATRSAALALSDQPHSDETEAVWDDFALVPVYDVQASAGHGSLVESELQAGQLAFKKSWLKEKGLQVGHLAIITARGDSMETTICDRDTLLVDTRVDKIIDDSIYIIQADHHLIVKRLQQDFDGSVFVISDNPRYEKRHLNAEQSKNLKIAGRVCWYGHEI